MLPTTFITIAAILGVASALPVESNLEKRNNPTDLPQNIVQLHQNDPDTYYGDTARTTQQVLLYQDVNASGQVADRITSLINFIPPSNSYGCELGITFPSDYTFPSYTGATPTLNVYLVSQPLPAEPTWNNIAPLIGSLWGTVTVAAGSSSIINSEACPTTSGGGLAFVLEYADWVGRPSSVAWSNYINEMDGAGLRGVYLTYDY